MNTETERIGLATFQRMWNGETDAEHHLMVDALEDPSVWQFVLDETYNGCAKVFEFFIECEMPSRYALIQLMNTVPDEWFELSEEELDSELFGYFFNFLALFHHRRALTYPQPFLRLIGSIANWNQYGRLLVFTDSKELLALLDIEVADPACGEALLCSRQTEMFHGNGNIDVAMMFAIRAHPFLIVQDGTDDIHRSRCEPLTVVALLQFRLVCFVLYHTEHPRLLVDR